MANGGGIKVGIEDNIWLTPKRDKLASNKDLLHRINKIATALEIEIATPQDVRVALALDEHLKG